MFFLFIGYLITLFYMTIKIPSSIKTFPTVLTIESDPLFTMSKLNMPVQIIHSCKVRSTSLTSICLNCTSKVDKIWILFSVNNFLMSFPVSFKCKLFPANITFKVSLVRMNLVSMSI